MHIAYKYAAIAILKLKTPEHLKLQVTYIYIRNIPNAHIIYNI